MEIAKNKTTLTKKMLFAFQNREIFRKSWTILICALAIILVSFTIVDGKIVLKSLPFLIIGALAYPLYIGILEIIFLIQNKSFIQVTVEYTFKENSIFLEGTSKLGNETSEVFYSNIYKVAFSKKYTYIYINKISAFVLDNNSFSVGSPEKLKALFELKFPEKVTGVKKKKAQSTTKNPKEKVIDEIVVSDVIQEKNDNNDKSIDEINSDSIEKNEKEIIVEESSANDKDSEN